MEGVRVKVVSGTARVGTGSAGLRTQVGGGMATVSLLSEVSDLAERDCK